MIPVRLALRNFMCYRGEPEVLDLTGVHVACLSGENGAGKSALLEAITWVLWGKARDRSIDDELISKGASDMEVDYHFMLGSQHYRVLRKRSRKGNTGTTILDVQVSPTGEEGTWRSLAGGAVRETQARINDLLKLDYDTFINSAFIMQGRADEFTVKNPADRKKVLAGILGLDEYDRLEELAREEARQRKARIIELDTHIARIEQELSRRADLDAQLKEVEELLVRTQQALDEAHAELDHLRAEQKTLEHNRQRLEELERAAGRLAEQISRAELRAGQRIMRRQQLEEILGRREEIERGYAEWQNIQVEVSRFTDMLTALRKLESHRSTLEGGIRVSEQQLKSEAERLRRDIATARQALDARSTLQRRLDGVLEKIEALEQLQRQHEDTRCLHDNLTVRYRQINNEIQALENEGKEIRQKLDLLMKAHAQDREHVGCPLCGTGLTEEAMERVRRSYETDIAEKRQLYEQKRKERDALKAQIAQAETRLAEEQARLSSLDGARKERADLEHQLRVLEETERRLEEMQPQLAALDSQLEQGDYAHEERRALAEVQAEIERLGYDEHAHQRARFRLSELAEMGYEKLHHELESAGPELDALLEELADIEHTINVLKDEQAAINRQEMELRPQIARRDEVTRHCAEVADRVAALDRESRDLERRGGELRNELKRCEQLQAEKKEREAERQTALDEKLIYEDLSTAFGKKGIQAMIIENVIPEVEEEANAMLARMTDGRMSVQFSTQRDAKTTRGVIETLDINIADEMGTRPYELYSGGEAFRVNFAIRIALSKLLARRAGAQLQTLVIDEGFGSQDGQGRERLISAIRSIQDDFEKILVITHLEELKDEFPVRINIIKTGSGSKIVMDEGD